MKKYIAVILALVLVVTCFAACGKKDDTPSGKTDKKIPVIFSAVSDPIDAQLVASLEAPGKNITGTSDYLDTKAIFNLILATVSSDSNALIGLLYDVGQDSSKTPIAEAKAFLDSKGIAYKEYTGRTVDEISLAVDSAIADKVSAIFTPTDNSIMTAELSIYEKLAEAGIPHFTGADSFALNGAFLGYGVDYANLGVETANMVAEVLIDGKDTATLAVKTFDNGTATINTEICANLGYDFKEISEKFAPFCQKINEIKTSEAFEDPNASNPASKLESGTLGAENAEKTFTIGICNFVDDASLNQIVSNIKVQLDKIGKEKNVAFVIKYDNCNTDSNVMNQIIAGFKADKVDLMVGVATPVAMAMQSATEEA